MNLYGFAAGDPVNFSDPFGLCPEDLKDKDGRCPGGLTDRQYEKVEYAAQNRTTPEARDLVLDLLKRGRISAATYDDLDGNAGVTSPWTRKIEIQDDLFNFKYAGDLAFLLVHEARHTKQAFYTLLSKSKRESDADAFACANVRDRHAYRSGAYRVTEGPCGSGK